MRMLSRWACVATLSLAAAGLSRSAEAVTYEYAGTCTVACDAVGLAAGDAVSGSISFLDAALVPGSPYPAPTGFSLQFGLAAISDATADSFGLFGVPLPPFPAPPQFALVGADPTSFAVSLHAGEDPVPPATAGDGVIAQPGFWSATLNGNCNDADCHFLFLRGTPAQGVGEWSRAAIDAAEPGVTSLFALALLGMGRTTRRDRRTRS